MCLQNGYFHPEGGCYLGGHSGAVLSGIVKFLKAKDAPGTEIIFFKAVRSVEDTYYRHRATANIVGSPDIQFVDEVAQMAKYIVYMPKPSAFQGTPFPGMLKSRDVYKITVVGAETHSAVCNTATTLRFMGYDVSVPEPLVTARDPFLHEAGITLLTGEYGVDVTAT